MSSRALAHLSKRVGDLAAETGLLSAQAMALEEISAGALSVAEERLVYVVTREELEDQVHQLLLNLGYLEYRVVLVYLHQYHPVYLGILLDLEYPVGQEHQNLLLHQYLVYLDNL